MTILSFVFLLFTDLEMKIGGVGILAPTQKKEANGGIGKFLILNDLSEGEA